MRLWPVLRTCFRSSRAQPLRTALLIFGIALGVAGVVAIDIARTSVSKSFELSTAALTARATHQILGSDFTLSQHLFTQIRTEAGIHKSAPVISRTVSARELGDGSLTLMGIDPFSEAPFRPLGGAPGPEADRLGQAFLQGRGVILSGTVAKTHGLTKGDTLTLVLGEKTVPVSIEAIVDTGNRMTDGLILADIGLAQQLLDMGSRISRIDLILETPDDEARVRRLLGPGEILVSTGKRNQTIRGLSGSFETSLSAFSVLVLFMGIFLIYNTVSFSVARRRALTGIFRALGATRQDIFIAVMTEVIVYALVGSALGLFMGILLGKGAVQAVCATVSDMYFTLTVSQTHILTATLIKGAVVGMGAALISSLSPALTAAGTPPVTLMQSSFFEGRLGRLIPVLSGAGIVLIALALTAFRLGTFGMGLVFSGVFMIFGGASLLSPALILILARILDRLAGRLPGASRIMAGMGIRNVRRSLSRTSVLIASLMVVISVYIGIDTMTHSFRQSLITWVDGNIGGDVHVSSLDERHEALPPGLLDKVTALPGVAAVSAYNIHRSFSRRSGEVHVFSYITDTSKKEWTWLDPLAGAGSNKAISDLLDKGWIAVSEIFARQNGLFPEATSPDKGLTVTMDTVKGRQAFRVAGIFRDFFMGGGRAVVSRKAMTTFWGKEEITAMQIFLSPGIKDKKAAISNTISRIRDASANPVQLRLRSGPAIKAQILAVFDNTFLITTALQILTALVALTGIINSVMALILERAREIGILRACGAEPSQVRTLVLWECGVAGFMAGLLSLPLGLFLSWVLVDVVNFQAFGWTYEVRIAPMTFIMALGFSTLAAVGAGLVPAVKAAQLPVAKALRTE